MISIVVFWQDRNFNPQAKSFSSTFDEDPMRSAMSLMETLRKAGEGHVCMSVENANSVGKPGVDTVADGKTPDGHPYEWSKQHRAGATRKRS